MLINVLERKRDSISSTTWLSVRKMNAKKRSKYLRVLRSKKASPEIRRTKPEKATIIR
jgi:hypothetical protein